MTMEKWWKRCGIQGAVWEEEGWDARHSGLWQVPHSLLEHVAGSQGPHPFIFV